MKEQLLGINLESMKGNLEVLPGDAGRNLPVSEG